MVGTKKGDRLPHIRSKATCAASGRDRSRSIFSVPVHRSNRTPAKPGAAPIWSSLKSRRKNPCIKHRLHP